MDSRWIALSRPRAFMVDMLHFASQVPSVPVQRRMDVSPLQAARRSAGGPSWPALFIKAFSLVADEMPVLKRSYVKFPWPHIVEYPGSVASIAIERTYNGEPAVFFGRIFNPSKRSVFDIHAIIREFVEAPLESIKPFRKALRFAGLPRFLRRLGLWWGLNLARTRAGLMGTFGLSVYSSLGAESLHPISPLTVTLTYGVIGSDGQVTVRMIYDHRVLDGATVARSLECLERKLLGPVLEELLSAATSMRIAS